MKNTNSRKNNKKLKKKYINTVHADEETPLTKKNREQLYIN